MSAWDDEDLETEPAVPVLAIVDKWGGEDDEDVKENWEDEEEQDPPHNGEVMDSKPEKKSLKQRLAEKEAKKLAEIEERKRKEEDVQSRMTPEERIAEKLRLQKLQEESDLLLAKEAFGVTNEKDKPEEASSLDAIALDSKADFDEFSKVLKEKLKAHEKSPHYFMFLDSLFHDLVQNLDAEDIKKLGSTMNAIANEKSKANKGAKHKKKKAGPKVVLENKAEQVIDDGYDEFDDFM